MTDDFTQNRSDKLVGIYERFQDTIDATAPEGKLIPYHGWTLPNPLGAIWIPYSSMLSEYATELANIINDLTNHVQRLHAWDKIIGELDNDDRLAVSHEFFNTLGTVALGQPYVVESRFSFASGHLCHKANRARQSKVWVDDFPEKNLYLNDIQPYGASWRKFSAFKVRLEAIADSAFKAASDDFRNVYNHGFSSRFVLGITSTVRRTVRMGRSDTNLAGIDLSKFLRSLNCSKLKEILLEGLRCVFDISCSKPARAHRSMRNSHKSGGQSQSSGSASITCRKRSHSPHDKVVPQDRCSEQHNQNLSAVYFRHFL